MKKRAYKNLILRITALVLIILIEAGMNYQGSLNAQTESGKIIITEEKTPAASENISIKKNADTPEIPVEITPAITELKTPESENEKKAEVKPEQEYIKAEEIFDHPEIILKAYKEAYPGLIKEVTKGEKDWILKFSNGNLYYWADGKILPEKALPESDKYVRYSINPYNMNGRSPELYSAEKIEKLRIKKEPLDKKKSAPGEEGGLYRELYGITTKKSAKKQLVEIKLLKHNIKVHRTLAEKIRSIDLNIKQLAKTDPEVRIFLKSISSVQSYNWRKISGSYNMSNHSYGIAIDILPKKYHKKTLYWSWEQDKNPDWMLLPQSSLWVPPDPVVKIFLKENFIWGGHWDRYDTMHFEYRPELISLSRSIKFNQ